MNEQDRKKISGKRTKKTQKLWGCILIIVGIFEIILGIVTKDVSDVIAGLFFGIPGLILIRRAAKQVKLWDRYEAAVDRRGNIPAAEIAEKVGKREFFIYGDLQEMIENKFFADPEEGIDAYLDLDRCLLVMTKDGQPIEPLPELPKKEEAKSEAKGEASEALESAIDEALESAADEPADTAESAADAENNKEAE